MVGDYVVLDKVEPCQTLVFSKSANRFPRFFLIPEITHTQSELLGVDENISYEDIENEYLAFQITMNTDEFRGQDQGQQKLLQACHSAIKLNHAAIEVFNVLNRIT